MSNTETMIKMHFDPKRYETIQNMFKSVSSPKMNMYFKNLKT